MMVNVTLTVEITVRSNDNDADATKKAVMDELANMAERGNVFAFTDNGKDVFLLDASDPSIPTDHRE